MSHRSKRPAWRATVRSFSAQSLPCLLLRIFQPTSAAAHKLRRLAEADAKMQPHLIYVCEMDRRLQDGAATDPDTPVLASNGGRVRDPKQFFERRCFGTAIDGIGRDFVHFPAVGEKRSSDRNRGRRIELLTGAAPIPCSPTISRPVAGKNSTSKGRFARVSFRSMATTGHVPPLDRQRCLCCQRGGRPCALRHRLRGRAYR